MPLEVIVPERVRAAAPLADARAKRGAGEGVIVCAEGAAEVPCALRPITETLVIVLLGLKVPMIFLAEPPEIPAMPVTDPPLMSVAFKILYEMVARATFVEPVAETSEICVQPAGTTKVGTVVVRETGLSKKKHRSPEAEPAGSEQVVVLELEAATKVNVAPLPGHMKGNGKVILLKSLNKQERVCISLSNVEKKLVTTCSIVSISRYLCVSRRCDSACASSISYLKDDR